MAAISAIQLILPLSIANLNPRYKKPKRKKPCPETKANIELQLMNSPKPNFRPFNQPTVEKKPALAAKKSGRQWKKVSRVETKTERKVSRFVPNQLASTLP